MKKFIFFYLLLIGFAYGEIADVSFVIKAGYAPYGFYTESLSGTSSYTEKVNLTNSIDGKLELHSRSKSFESLYYGVGFAYIGSGTLSKSLLNSTSLGVDYYPFYFFLQNEVESNHYPGWEMFFNFRAGLSYEKDKGRIKGDAGFSSALATPSPYAGLSWGFEQSNFIAEVFYDLNIGASANLTEFGDTILMQSSRIGLSLGCRLNSGYRF